ncbi:MAG: N-formylglutamate amidohydrolase, partial [Roseibium sp.]|nr:N-formylglutamate amidohydrolase [Roseibium sp.]
VYYTIRRHGEERGLPCLMVEIRNDEVKTVAEESRWADILAPILSHAAEEGFPGEAGGVDA